jgi:sugar lactone lactonase YvrE
MPILLADGFYFPEGPRWHDGLLWLSDQHAHTVYTVDASGTKSARVKLDDMPSGLGFLPDGSLLISSMRARQLLRYDGDRVTQHADLTSLGKGWINDMVVDTAGRAYVGFTYGDLYTNSEQRAAIVSVDIDGTSRLATTDVSIPNGSAITPDGGTLIVGESGAAQVSSFAITLDGRLADKRVFAKFDTDLPDGVCLDAEGAVWMASPRGCRFLRVRAGGEILDEIQVGDDHAVACMLGGPERRTLHLVISRNFSAENLRVMSQNSDPGQDAELSAFHGRVETVAVAVPGAGLP